MEFNYLILAIAAIIPMILGFVWYHKKVFGTAWMKQLKFTDEDLKGGNMLVTLGLAYIFSFFLTMIVNFLVIHQYGFFQTLMNEPGLMESGTEINTYAMDFMDKYGSNFRTFKHGALHGTMAGLFFALPVLGTNALFEKKGFKYIAINVGFWTVCLALMGGVICQFS